MEIELSHDEIRVLVARWILELIVRTGLTESEARRAIIDALETLPEWTPEEIGEVRAECQQLTDRLGAIREGFNRRFG